MGAKSKHMLADSNERWGRLNMAMKRNTGKERLEKKSGWKPRINGSFLRRVRYYAAKL